MTIMKKILITAFEPFGLTGAFLRKANASGEVMGRLQAILPPDQYDFLTLPVSSQSAEIFQRHLKALKPDGVLCLGEHLTLKPGHVQLENYAHDCAVSLNPLTPFMGQRVLSSAFAESIAPLKNKSTIGAYHCNNIYKNALQWSQANDGAPAAFLHVAVFGDRDRQSADVLKVVGAMQDFPSSSARRNPAMNAAISL